MTDLKHLQFTGDVQIEKGVNNSKFSKRDYFKFITQTKGLSYESVSKYKLLDATGSIAVAKLASKYAPFRHVDYITMSNKDKG